MHSIPDIRLFWTKDPRFIEQFKILESGENVVEYKSFSKYPGCYKDVSFWGHNFTDNDMNDLVRDVANDLVESVKLVHQFTYLERLISNSVFINFIYHIHIYLYILHDNLD